MSKFSSSCPSDLSPSAQSRGKPWGTVYSFLIVLLVQIKPHMWGNHFYFLTTRSSGCSRGWNFLEFSTTSLPASQYIQLSTHMFTCYCFFQAWDCPEGVLHGIICTPREHLHLQSILIIIIFLLLSLLATKIQQGLRMIKQVEKEA